MQEEVSVRGPRKQARASTNVEGIELDNENPVRKNQKVNHVGIKVDLILRVISEDLDRVKKLSNSGAELGDQGSKVEAGHGEVLRGGIQLALVYKAPGL